MADVNQPGRAEVAVESGPEGSAVLLVSGSWQIGGGLPDAEQVCAEARSCGASERLICRAEDLEKWDSALVAFLVRLRKECREHGLEVVSEGLPEGVRRLLDLAASTEESAEAPREPPPGGLLARIGRGALVGLNSSAEAVTFLGEVILSFGRLLRGQAVFRGADLWLAVQNAGARALPLVSLISLLVGTILAFVGAYQLRTFGAEIYIAAGVGLGMVREMAPMMTGILMAGRSGAAYAAHIGTMRVNEEVDAFQTLGISPVDFLVLPRVLAMIIMLPMLCLYSDLMGILGGAAVSFVMFDIPPAGYFDQVWQSVTLRDLAVGVTKAGLFGLVVAMAGCLKGLRCERSASGVGEATTSAVVTGIVAIIVLDSVAAIIYTFLGI